MSTGIKSINLYAEDLVDELGTTLVAYMTGVRSRQEPLRWAHQGVEPRDEAKARLLLAHQVWFDVSNEDGPDVARQWFIGSNPWLSGDSPAERIRNGDSEAVLAAATAFASDQGGA